MERGTGNVPLEAMHRAVYERLLGDLYGDPDTNTPPEDGGTSVPVLGEVDEDSSFPYVDIGEVRFTSADTKDRYGWEGGVTVEVYSAKRTMKEVDNLINRVTASLTRDDVIIGDFTSIHRTWEEISVRDVIDNDGSTLLKVGVVRQRLKLL